MKSNLEASHGQETAREDQGRSGKPREVKVISHHLPKMEDDLLNPLITFGQHLNTECSCFKSDEEFKKPKIYYETVVNI